MTTETIVPCDEDALSLVSALDEILSRVVGAFEAKCVPLPERRYWTFGQITQDCEQVVVAAQQMFLGGPGDEVNEPQRCNSPRSVVLDVQILRCSPKVGNNGKPPSAESIQKAAALQAIDMWVLLDIAANLDTWDGDLPGYGLGVLATVDAGTPSGGFFGPTLRLTVAVP